MSLECARTEDRLSDFLDGSLDERERPAVAAHLARCASCRSVLDGLATTVAALRSVPPEKAPPELLSGVKRMIAAEGAAVPPPGPAPRRSLLLPSIGAVAAAFLALLTYGVLRESARTTVPGIPASPPRVESSAPGSSSPSPVAPTVPAKEASGGRTPRQAANGSGAGLPRTRETDVRIPEDAAARRSALPSIEAAAPSAGVRTSARTPGTPDRGSTGPAAAAPALPAAPVSRVSTEGGILRAPAWPSAPGEEAPRRLFSWPPSRMPRPTARGREIVLVVTADRSEGLEGKVRECAARLGGKPVGEPVSSVSPAAFAKASPPAGAQMGKSADGALEKAAGVPAAEARREPLRFLLPASAADAFLADLRGMGTVLADARLRADDAPQDVPPEVETVTVTIRVR